MIAAASLTTVFATGKAQPASLSLSEFPFYELSYTYEAEGLHTSSFVYNDGYFLQDSNTFSPELAKIGVALSAIAYDRDGITTLLSSEESDGGMGFTVYDNSAAYDKVENHLTISDNDYVAYTIAKKVVSDYVIYCVPIKGTGEGAEWYSNFNLGNGEEHAGFSKAARRVYNELCSYLEKDNYAKERIILYFTGHSRGAAAANLLAGWFTEGGEYAEAKHIFGYTFACPSVSTKADTSADNIFNFNNPGDLIPMLPSEEWGYKRYGISYDIVDSDVLDNLRQQFKRITGKEYKAVASSSEYSMLIKNAFPSVEAYNKPSTRLLLNLVASALAAGNKSSIRSYLRLKRNNPPAKNTDGLNNLLFEDGSVVISDRILHGHATVTYVLLINSMFYGYKGWCGYNTSGELLDIVVSDDIVSIGSGCFESSTGVRSVKIGNSVRYLGENVIRDASGLKLAALVEPDVEGTLGANNELSWSFCRNTGMFTVRGEINANEPVIIASYDNNGKIVSQSIITESFGLAKAGADCCSVKAFWIDENCLPKCAEDIVYTFMEQYHDR